MPNDPGAPLRKKRPDKQRTSRGASFKRMAKDLRVIARNYKRIVAGQMANVEMAILTHDLAEVFDAEAARLRAMP